MELFVLIILGVFLGFIGICTIMDRRDTDRNIEANCLKTREELLMENDGDDPCAEGQVITVRQRLCESQPWIITSNRG